MLVDIEGTVLFDGMIIDYHDIKEFIDKLDHKIILPQNGLQYNPTTQRHDCPEHIEFEIGKKRYFLPNEDVILIPVEVVTSETLAGYIAQELFNKHKNIQRVEVTINESKGNTASDRRTRCSEATEEKVSLSME